MVHLLSDCDKGESHHRHLDEDRIASNGLQYWRVLRSHTPTSEITE